MEIKFFGHISKILCPLTKNAKIAFPFLALEQLIAQKSYSYIYMTIFSQVMTKIPFVKSTFWQNPFFQVSVNK